MKTIVKQSIDKYTWWASLKHGGLLISPSRLSEFFVEEIQPLPQYVEDRLRQSVVQLPNGERESLSYLLDTVLEDVLQLDKDYWQKGNSVAKNWSYRAVTGEIIKPRRLWQEPNGGLLPVFVADFNVKRLGIGKGKRSLSRVIEWLRKANQKVALLTNGRQWRLVHAGIDYDAWCEWDIDFWFEGGKPGLQVEALRSLLGKRALTAEKSGAVNLLNTAIQLSRQGQAELSAVLGERVRQAVELLIQETFVRDASIPDLTPRQIYLAATRTIMRCVVILFAEARNLLPRDNPIYNNSYSLQGLRELLDRTSGGRSSERLRHSYSAYPRILALFRLLYQGCHHEALPIPRYGGGLFTPGSETAADPIIRALAVLENPPRTPSDAVVYRILELLCRSKVKVRQGRGNIWVEASVDFSDLSSEYIGILYEGLLDYELRQAAADEPIVFLNLGDRPALSLVRLEDMDDEAISALVEKLKKKDKSSNSGDESESEEITVEVDETEKVEDTDVDEDNEEQEIDIVQQLRDKAHSWAVRAVKVGKLVAKPRSKKQSALAEYDRAVNGMANQLIARIVLPGQWFLIRWGGTRKGSGTFYTRPQLAVPTMHQTLLPLVYEADTPKKPEQILSLKIADISMGSGSFLVAALKFLTDVLYESLHYHQCIQANGNKTLCRLADGNGTNSLFDEPLPVLPDADDFEERMKARLKRYLVERCLYGVDIDPLAVELARLALWIETMDRTLPFSFLDHKLKCGNSLVGCWFDRFQDYPAMAWSRDGGDTNHNKFVHHFRKYVVSSGKNKGKEQQKGDKWTQAIKDVRNEIVKPELKELLETLDPANSQIEYPNFDLPALPEKIHDEALGIFQELHDLPVHETAAREQTYREKIVGSKTIHRLKLAFDTWCAVWFWSGEALDIAPTPSKFFQPTAETREMISQLAQQYQFFHWELEFPDVFTREKGGFDAIIGNPPWEIQKPNSMEFFSNIDPLYRTYGKQEAIQKQLEYFGNNPQIEKDWLAYCDRLKALSNWVKNVGFPFGDPAESKDKFSLSRSAKETERLHQLWRDRREQQLGYADCRHSFRLQGSADINTYKLFLEQSLLLLNQNGRMGLIVPSGVYTDKGSTDLRTEFLSHCQWEWLFGFENRDGIFDIHRSFKFCPLVIQKGGETKAIKASFMQRSLTTWSEPESHILEYPRARVEQFSPNSKAILEIRSQRDLRVLEKIYANSVLLGDDSPQGWGIKYAAEFHMTADSKLFPPRPNWEQKGYQPDEYGHWLKGNWQDYEGESSILQRREGLILSADGSQAIDFDEVQDIALPLYEGRMVGQFDFSEKGWVSGKGRTALWRDISWHRKIIEPQFLMSIDNYSSKNLLHHKCKVGMMDVSSTTNTRTVIATVISGYPCGNKVPTLLPEPYSLNSVLAFSAIINSFTYDFIIRSKLGGQSINWYVLEETVISQSLINRKDILLSFCIKLTFPRLALAKYWLKLSSVLSPQKTKSWYQLWAITPYERLRLRCILDAVIAELYGLEIEDFAWILKECDYPEEQVCDKTFSRTLDPKGFWRVDKEKDPELRHTVLSLVAFHELKRLGLETFLNLNNGEGWMLPDTLRLADYGLGRDERAKQSQPVTSRLGDRYLPWQLEGTPESSWAECERHAENLRRLLGDNSQSFNQPQPTITPKYPSDPNYKPPTDLFGNPLEVDLFGKVVEKNAKRR